MKLLDRPLFDIAELRYKAYRTAKRIALGPLMGGATGTHLFRNLEEASAHAALAEHIADRRLLAPANIQNYPFPESYPAWFARSEAFAARYQYLLSDIVASPASGGMWIPGVAFLQQSMGSIPRIFSSRWGARETLRAASPMREDKPVCIAPGQLGYYHWLLEALPEVLHAKAFQPECKIITSDPPRRYLIDSLAFLDLPPPTIVRANAPLRIPSAILTPRWVNSGFVPPEDIAILRNAILPRLLPCAAGRLIYISRSRSKNRPIQNEPAFESALAALGFEIHHFEDLGFKEQMQLCHEAQCLVAPHGAGLSNMIACRPETAVHELISTNWPNVCYAKLAVQLGLNYSYSLLAPDGAGAICIDIPAALADLQAVLEKLGLDDCRVGSTQKEPSRTVADGVPGDAPPQ